MFLDSSSSSGRSSKNKGFLMQLWVRLARARREWQTIVTRAPPQRRQNCFSTATAAAEAEVQRTKVFSILMQLWVALAMTNNRHTRTPCTAHSNGGTSTSRQREDKSVDELGTESGAFYNTSITQQKQKIQGNYNTNMSQQKHKYRAIAMQI